MNDQLPQLTPQHVKAARALLAWSQQDLAKAAAVATSTVADFERGHRTPVANNAQAIRGALEGAGIRFLPTGAVIGPPVPSITSSDRPGAPVRWVSAEDLSDWANRTDGAVSLPTLVASLIRATLGTAVTLRFPSDEGVRHPGWDGRTSTETGNAYVPPGDAGWEIGTQRNNVAQKAMEDFRKRTAAPAPLIPSEASYIFVTPRHWPSKDEWAKARQLEGVWREVRAYDADDLVHWIELAPVVGLWLAIRLGKRPDGTRELEEVWEEWSLATKWPLTEDLVLSDRDKDSAEILRWLRQDPSVLSVQATSADEVLAFFHATLSMLPDDVSSAYRARCLVATTPAAARALAEAPSPLILLLADPEPGLAESLTRRGHYVLQAYDDRPASPGAVRTLARPSREGIAVALTAAGIAEPRAEALARDCARNLSILRRLIPGAPGRLPKWAQGVPPRPLLAALLAGGWDENSDADKARLAELADQAYDDVIAALAPFVGEFDSPLQKVGSTWRIASPPDAWSLLASYLAPVDIARFEAAAHAVLGSADPRSADAKCVGPAYSGVLRQGIGHVLILLALWGDKVRTVPNAARRTDAIVGKLLSNSDEQRWRSLSGDFRLLAEASPAAFLSALEDSLDKNDPPIRALFNAEKGFIFETEHVSDLLWSLESLAWSPNLMPRVSVVLARLDAIDTKPSRSLNRPANSLRDIHRLWMPQTFATFDERVRALDLVRKQESDAAWKLMLNLLPRAHESSTPSPVPRWRDFSVDKVEVVTWGLIARGAAALTERLLTDVGVNAARWSLLIDRIADLAPDPEAAFSALEKAERRITVAGDRAILRDRLRRFLHHHRQFPDAEWSMPGEALDRLEVIYDCFAPADSLERISWLFEQFVPLPRPSTEGWEAEARDVDAARRQAAAAIFSSGGIPAVLALAREVGAPGYIGKAIYDGGLSDADIDRIIEESIKSDHPTERDVAHGLIISAFQDRKEPWAAALIARAIGDAWGDTALLAILLALPNQRWTWNQAANAGAGIEESYWRQAPVFWMSDDNEEIAFAIRKLISVGRARHALPLAARDKKVQLSSALLVEVLREAVRQPFESQGVSNEANMFQHYVGEILKVLDERADVDMDTLASLEWAYLSLLEYSGRPTKVLLRALSEHPSLFIQVLSAAFKPSEESGILEPTPEDSERASDVAYQAYRLLNLWNRLPGTQDDGTIHRDVLEAWIKQARTLARAAGREEIADSKIGTMLSASPIGSDGNWPAEAVREVIDLFRSKPMISGFLVGKMNRRGVTMRLPRDGGDLERREAAKFREWAKATSFEHPYTARALDTLAENYESEARRHDEDVQRLDWH